MSPQVPPTITAELIGPHTRDSARPIRDPELIEMLLNRTSRRWLKEPSVTQLRIVYGDGETLVLRKET